MAIRDGENMYSDSQALTATAASTNLIDHGADRDLGKGEPLALVINVEVALDGTTGDETYAAVLQTDDNASFSSATTVVSAPTMTRGDAAGTQYVAVLPPNTTIERYTRVSYTLGGTSPTATVSAWLVPLNSLHTYAAFADGITIS
jgi:hypothetical protein